jgi:hydrogenase-4 component B
LALACFTKAFGIVFLGSPRVEHANEVHEVGMAMRIPMVILAFGCFAVGLFAPIVIAGMIPAIAQVSQLPLDAIESVVASGTAPLNQIVIAFSILLASAALLALLRVRLLKGRMVKESVTWDCGYAQPTPRMQYTASSFAQPITRMFHSLLRTRRHLSGPEGIFPKSAALETHTPDVFQELLFRPIFAGVQKALDAFRWLQHGNVHLYVLYILITLLTLMFWKLR